MAFRGQDLWRRHPIFRWGFTDALPGLREGAAAFGVYMAAEYVYKTFYAPPEDDHHGAGHHGGHAESHGHTAHGQATAHHK